MFLHTLILFGETANEIWYQVGLMEVAGRIAQGST